jgi:hypothetical protein
MFILKTQELGVLKWEELGSQLNMKFYQNFKILESNSNQRFCQIKKELEPGLEVFLKSKN